MMDPDFISTIFPPYWRGVTKNHVSCQDEFALFGFDTETSCGRVFATGFYDGMKFKMLHGLGKDHFGWLIDNALRLTGKGHKTFVGAAHYLIFDLSVLLWPILHPDLPRRRGESAEDYAVRNAYKLRRAPKVSRFSLIKQKVEIEVMWTKPCLLRIKKDKRTIYLIDSYSFFTMSLARALKAVGSKVSKLDKPEGLGYRVIPKKEVTPYLTEDCRGVFDLLTYIRQLHEKYKTRLCYSLPMLSARVFRHYFLKDDFQKPSGPLVQAALLSYHGGKNLFPAKPGWHKACWDLDINSAYPEAMRQLPDFENGSWEHGKGLSFVREHPHGIYCISGVAAACKWPVLYSHDFHTMVGVVRKLWVTGYELMEAVDSGELRLDHVEGYGWAPSAEAGESAFKLFVDHFYTLRMETTDPVWRMFYKLLLNSLYGKFVQRNDEEQEDGTISRVAGACFDPTIASLITGFVRARLHRLEHKYKALHTATDGFITQVKPDPADLGEGLGRLKQETFGPVLILRNKLYIHYDDKGVMKKTGLHGFEGSAEDLLKLYKQSKRLYRVKRLSRWAEAWHTGVPPGVQVEIEKELKLAEEIQDGEGGLVALVEPGQVGVDERSDLRGVRDYPARGAGGAGRGRRCGRGLRDARSSVGHAGGT